MAMHLHCPVCGELLAEDRVMVTTSAGEGTRQETYELACRCGTRLRLQLPPERWAPPTRRRGRGRGRRRRVGARADVVAADVARDRPPGPSPSAERPYPFTPWQYARLLVLRGRIQDGDVAETVQDLPDTPTAT